MPIRHFSGSPITYTNWAQGESVGSRSDCAIMDVGTNGEWYDYNCADRNTFFVHQNGHHYFVCEYGEFQNCKISYHFKMLKRLIRIDIFQNIKLYLQK